MHKDKSLLSLAEAAEILNISTRTLRAWRRQKKHLTFIQLGRILRISRDDLDKFVEEAKNYPLSKES